MQRMRQVGTSTGPYHPTFSGMLMRWFNLAQWQSHGSTAVGTGCQCSSNPPKLEIESFYKMLLHAIEPNIPLHVLYTVP